MVVVVVVAGEQARPDVVASGEIDLRGNIRRVDGVVGKLVSRMTAKGRVGASACFVGASLPASPRERSHCCVPI